MIGNTDMHYGNISHFPTPTRPLAMPASYDMLPICTDPMSKSVLPIRFCHLDKLETAGKEPFFSTAATYGSSIGNVTEDVKEKQGGGGSIARINENCALAQEIATRFLNKIDQ